MAKIEMTGLRFGRLTVLKDSGRRKDRKIVWTCACDCGKTVDVIGTSLRSGLTQSCGCLKQEVITKHGESGTKLYSHWEGIIDRTTNSNNSRSHRYMERGITVCDEWREYQNFSKWAKENGYSEELSLDRINNDGNYEPNNCRWVDMKTQGNNRSTNNNIEFDGKTQTLTQWAEELGINKSTLSKRIHRGWSVERALTTK